MLVMVTGCFFVLRFFRFFASSLTSLRFSASLLLFGKKLKLS